MRYRWSRTGVRVAEGAGLENRYTLTGIVGSNPTLSVVLQSLRNVLQFVKKLTCSFVTSLTSSHFAMIKVVRDREVSRPRPL